MSIDKQKETFQHLYQALEKHTYLAREVNSRPSQEHRKYEQRIRDFLTEVSRLGEYLSQASERKSADSIIEYWAAWLRRIGKYRIADSKTLKLKDAEVVVKYKVIHEEQPELVDPDAIRFGTIARLWKAAGEDPSFVILGRDAIKLAEKFSTEDTAIKQLLDSSKRRIRIRDSIWFVGTLVCIGAIYAAYEYIVPSFTEWHKRNFIAEDTERKANELEWATLYSRWVPPGPTYFNFTRSTMCGEAVESISAKGYNFMFADWRSVRISNSDFGGSFFSESTFRNLSVEKSSLALTQFRDVTLIGGVFSNIDLSRANFDGAMLYDVEFSNVVLFKTSFRGARFTKSSLESLAGNAWWQALDWSSSELKAFFDMSHQTDRNAEAFAADGRKRLVDVKSGLKNNARWGDFNTRAEFYLQWGRNVGSPISQLACPQDGSVAGDDSLSLAVAAVCRTGSDMPGYQATAKATLGYAQLQAVASKLQEAQGDENWLDDDRRAKLLAWIAVAQQALGDAKKENTPNIDFLISYGDYLRSKALDEQTGVDTALKGIVTAASSPKFASYDQIYNLRKAEDDAIRAAIFEGIDSRSKTSALLCTHQSASTQQSVPGVQAAKESDEDKYCAITKNNSKIPVEAKKRILNNPSCE
ncbi:pentapeptide repeat-containing protein [Rhizobium ruizarguesonis]